MSWRAVIQLQQLDEQIVEDLCEGLTRANVTQLRLLAQRRPGRRPPLLYESGVRYQREPRGREVWRGIVEVLRRGFGDCEDLACWRAAERRLLFGDAAARAICREQPRSRQRGRLLHVLVQHGDGRIEDPSKRLGMSK